MEICSEIERWVERRVEEPIRRARERSERRCRRRPWWDPRRWFCEVVNVVYWVVEVVVRIIKELVTEVVCRLVSLVLVFAGFLLNLVMAIPILGSIISLVVRIIWFVLSVIVGAVTWLVERIFGAPTKKLRVRAIVFADETGPLATAAQVEAQIATANTVFAQCNVQVRLIGLHIYQDRVNAGDLLDYSDCDSFWNIVDRSIWVRAWQHELEAGSSDYEKNWRRFVPWLGGYVTLFVVRSMGDELGCSHGPFTDNIAAIGAALDPSSPQFDATVVAHELGHACALQHEDDRPGDLMFPNAGRGTNLTAGDCFWIRSAPFANYL